MAKNSFCYPRFPEEETMKQKGENGFIFQEIMPQGVEEEDRVAAISASNSHSHSHSHRQAEKRRRDRINAQLAKLRKLIPKSDKLDKAALLERVVEQVRDLKRKASEISNFLSIPTEIDEVTVEYHTDVQQSSPTISRNHHKSNKKDESLLKVTLCCEDRPDLINELVRALKGLKLTTVEADIVCLGGRMKSILILHNEEKGSGEKERVCNVSAIKHSLMAVLTRIVSWSTSTPSYRVSSKRQRFFFSPY